jgi:hypothetical protein
MYFYPWVLVGTYRMTSYDVQTQEILFESTEATDPLYPGDIEIHNDWADGNIGIIYHSKQERYYKEEWA